VRKGVGPRLFGGGTEEDAAHLAPGEIEDDAAVDRTHDKGVGIACFAIDMLGVSLTRGALRVPDLDALSGRKAARRGCKFWQILFGFRVGGYQGVRPCSFQIEVTDFIRGLSDDSSMPMASRKSEILTNSPIGTCPCSCCQ
jgi:hypothetical protein